MGKQEQIASISEIMFDVLPSFECLKVVFMDKDLLARKLYSERVNSLIGDKELDEELLEQMWENKASPTEAAKAMTEEQGEFSGPAWLSRYLSRR